MSKAKRDVLGKILLIFGLVLLIAAIGVVGFIKISKGRSDIDNVRALSFIEEILPERTPGFKEERSNPELSSVSYNGIDYVAILEIPAHSVKLPVVSEWNKHRVNYVPCRFTGNLFDGSLIIGGADAEGQFDFISNADIGDALTVTDMMGEEFHYTVKTVKHVKNVSVQTLSDDRYDLTLFAHSRKTHDYILLRCSLPQ